MAEVPKPSESFLTSKKGGLPIWAWGAIGLVIAVAYSAWRAKKNGPSKSDTSSASDTSGTPDESTSVPDYVNETNITNIQPPAQVITPPPVAQPKPPISTLPWPPPIHHKPPTTPPGKKPPAPKPKPKVIEYRVKRGDTLSSIAKKYHTSVDAIWTYNTTKGNRPDKTIATLKKRGKNLIFKNEEFDIVIPTK